MRKKTPGGTNRAAMADRLAHLRAQRARSHEQAARRLCSVLED